MQLVEQHVIRKNSLEYGLVDTAAFAAKNPYSAANSLARQPFISGAGYLSYTGSTP
jgi:hypothetical protein